MSEFDTTDESATRSDLEETAIAQNSHGLSRRAFLARTGAASLGALTLYAAPKIATVRANPAYSAATGIKNGPGTVVTKSFGSLPEATFGGTGIPNHAVAITEITGLAGGIAIKLGLTATQRFSNPAVTNDGSGNFFAPNGTTFDVGLNSDVGKWNFNYYMKVTGGTFADCKFCILYDFDPASSNAQSGWGKIDVNAGIVANFGAAALGATTLVEDSQNLTFAFLDTPIPGVITPPTHPTFDANATGEYGFALIAKDAGGTEIGRTEMKVHVSDTGTP